MYLTPNLCNMKIRILILSLIGVIFFNSCSSDSNSSDSNSNNSTSQNLDPNTLLPKQIMISDRTLQRFYKCNFFYNGNKIDHTSFTLSYFNEQSQTIVSFSSNVNYTYDGNFITKIEYDGGYPVYNFTYSNGKISTCNGFGEDNDFNINFQYGSNGSVVRTFSNPQNPTPSVVNLNNLPIGIPSSFSFDNEQSNVQYTGTNSVYKNIIGFNEVLSNMFFCDLIGYNSSFYFLIDWFRKFSPIYNYASISNSGGDGNYSYSYVYNEINFPTSYAVQQVSVLSGVTIKEYGTIIYY